VSASLECHYSNIELVREPVDHQSGSALLHAATQLDGIAANIAKLPELLR
jgi:hypothetical protein